MEIAVILINIIIFIVGLFLGKFLPSYMTEKGKNIATKEDIGDITKIIEETKIDYIMNIESFKNELSKEISKYSEEIKIISSDSYNRYIQLYSKLYQAVLQSEYLRGFLNIQGTFEEVPFIELHRKRTNEVLNADGYKREVVKIEDGITSLNKKFLIDKTFEYGEYASERLIKVAVGYRYIYEFYTIEDHPLHQQLMDEELKILNEFIELIVRETNELKKALGFDYNLEEIKKGRIQ